MREKWKWEEEEGGALEKMNRLSAPSNDKWRPQDCASDIQLTRPPPTPRPLRRRQVQGGPHPGPGLGHHHHVDRSRSVCLLLTFNQQSPNYCSARVRTSDVIAIFAFPLFSRARCVLSTRGGKEDSWTRIFSSFRDIYKLIGKTYFFNRTILRIII